MANLTSYNSVRTNLFVSLAVDEYRTSSIGAYSSTVLRFTDADTTTVVNAETFIPLGKLLNITPVTSEIRPSADSITVALSGIPTNSVEEILYSKIKGSSIIIYRGFYNVSTDAEIEAQTYFNGRVSNFSVQEEFEIEGRSGSLQLLLECSNNFSILEQKIAGRKTNGSSEKSFFPSDVAMDRVATIADTKFNFGAP
tara:strand:- start:3712 stop:4302 length:591 start_codon:yes stop_codon:yes gene_type:complete